MSNNRELAAVGAATLLYADLLTDDAFDNFDGSLGALTRLIQELEVIAKVDFDPETVTPEELVGGFYAAQEAVSCGDAAPDWWMYV